MATSRPIESPCRNDATGSSRHSSNTSCPASCRLNTGSPMSTNSPSAAAVIRCCRRANRVGRVAARAAMNHAIDEDAEKRRALELALEKARYEAKRAQRQFDLVDPENRLVASELEARWNEALGRVRG